MVDQMISGAAGLQPAADDDLGPEALDDDDLGGKGALSRRTELELFGADAEDEATGARGSLCLLYTSPSPRD